MTQSLHTTNGINWQEIFHQIPTGIVVIDGQGMVTDCNQSAEKILNTSLLNQSWVTVIQKCFSPKEDDGHEISLKNGRRVNIAVQSFDSRPGELIVINDLTVTRKFEYEKERQNRLVEMGEMVAHLAHQIRTPLASAMLHLNNLNNPSISDDKKNTIINKIKICHENIEQQIQDLLLFSRGGNSLIQQTSIDNLLNRIQEKISPKLNLFQASLFVESIHRECEICCNIDSLEGAICNLIDNALNANAKRLMLNINKKENEVVITLIDDGNGISHAVINKVTRPFFTTRANGTGLGLAVVDAVVKSHKGKMKIYSQEGQGSTFIINIPLINEKTKGKYYEDSTHC